MNPTQKMTAEIEVYQQEIEKLKSELAALSQSQNPPDDTAPGKLKDAFLATANETQQRILSRQAIQDAIAVLEQIFSDKKAALARLELEEENTFRQRRLVDTRPKIEALIQKINAQSEVLEGDIQELKVIFQEVNPDFRALQIHVNPDPAAGWSCPDLVTFKQIALPIAAHQGQGYVVGSRPLNLYEVEQSTSLQRQAESARLRADRRAALAQEQRQKQEEDAHQREESQLRVLLKEKTQTLQHAETERAKYEAMGAIDVATINRTITALGFEIEALQDQLQQLGDAA